MLTRLGAINANLIPVEDTVDIHSDLYLWRRTLPYPMESDDVDRGYAVTGSAMKGHPKQARHVSNTLVGARHPT